jgi:hypothetical protein
MLDNNYTNLCNSIRFTDDVSFKLLGLVPLFSGSGMLVAVAKSEWFWSPAIYAIGAFGALITLGLFRWELRNIQTCDWLISCGAAMEQTEDHLKAGQFYRKPKPPMRVGKTRAEKLIYGVTTLIWLLLPWLVYSTVKAKNNAAPVVDQTLNTVYIIVAVVIGILTLLSIILRVNADPEPPSKERKR